MPFGLTNAPTIIQILMNDIFRPYLWGLYWYFFYDILVYSRLSYTHQENMEIVFSGLQKQQLLAKKSKYFFLLSGRLTT